MAQVGDRAHVAPDWCGPGNAVFQSEPAPYFWTAPGHCVALSLVCSRTGVLIVLLAVARPFRNGRRARIAERGRCAGRSVMSTLTFCAVMVVSLAVALSSRRGHAVQGAR